MINIHLLEIGANYVFCPKIENLNIMASKIENLEQTLEYSSDCFSGSDTFVSYVETDQGSWYK